MSTTHDNQTEQYIEPYTEPPMQQIPTTHDLQAAAAQGDSEAAQQLERYAPAFKSAYADALKSADVAKSLAGKPSST